MSEPEPNNSAKHELLNQGKPVEEKKIQKQIDDLKNILPNSPVTKQQNDKQTNVIHPRRVNSSQSEKSQSRQRSRQKNYISKQQKPNKRIDPDQHYRNDRIDRNDRRKGYHYQQQTKFMSDPNVKEQAYRKTKMCPQFQRGQCRKGSECNFAHNQSELRGLPDFRKTKLCIAFKEGKCGKLSSQCKYAHGQNQLRRMPKVSNERQQKKQRSPKRQKHSHVKHSNYGYVPPPNYSGYIPPQNPYMNPYLIPAPMNQNQYMPPQMPNRPPINTYSNSRNFSSEYIPQPNTTNPNVNFGNYGSLGPTGGFYPPPVYDPYGHYSLPPPPPNYGYPPPGPKPPM